jgi:hypothetical protein
VRAQPGRKPARGLRLSAAGAHSGDGDHRPSRPEHGGVWAEQGEIGTGRQGDRRTVHDVGVADVAVGEYHPIDPRVADQVGQAGFIDDRDAVRVALPGKHRWIPAPGDVRDLGRRERDDLGTRVVPVHHVEVVKVAPGGAHDCHPDGSFGSVRHRASSKLGFPPVEPYPARPWIP